MTASNASSASADPQTEARTDAAAHSEPQPDPRAALRPELQKAGVALGENPTLGWIGTGRMGHAMAARLVAAGRDVRVWNRTRAKAEDLGAVVVDAVADLAGRDVVFTMVSADADLDQVLLGTGGLLRQQDAPRVVVDSSTVSQEASARIRAAAAERGIAFLAAPVSGNAKVIKAGLLSIAVSGPADAYDEVLPLLLDIGGTVTYVGQREEARLVKLAHNVFLGVVTQSLAEVLVLAEKGGVSRAALMGFLNGSVMGSVFSGYKTPALVNLDLTPTFTTTLLRKDLDLGLTAAKQSHMPMPLAAVTRQLVEAAVARGHGEQDFAALLVEQARNSGLELASEDAEVSDGLGARDPAPIARTL
jgi:3-hydroxyisobutyrate dehydrogenase-like beta-hydroxyacid dehydrogenase